MQNELAILDHTGDTKMLWDPSNTDEVENAKRTFKDLRAKGYLAYTVTGKDGEEGEMITSFDAQAGKIIMKPPMRGG